MKIYKTDEIKNIALLGSKGSGKTTLAESMLYECGVIKRRGSVAAGNTVSDYFPVEKEYGYSVFSTVFNAEFNGKKLNVIDCPGADDFVGNSYTALGVCDTGVIVVNTNYGVEVGTQNIFRTTAKLKKPVVFALNQIDGEKADYDNVIEQLHEHFGNKVVQVQYPIECGPGFHSMIDVLLMKKYEWGPDGGVPTVSEIPADQLEKAEELHNALVEKAAENDESLMEKYFEEGHLSEDEMREGIRKGMILRDLYPVFIVSAQKDMAVRRMMEFLGNICPFVSDM
ncbi:MAG: GTP-binding protein, partial [Muribaculaceae bacterium]|nr:GTP-binding protein [Muribaculaceae bacterium]